MQVFECLDALCVDRVTNMCNISFEWVHCPTLLYNCGYKRIVFILFSFDGLVCKYVVCECEFYFFNGWGMIGTG